MLLVQALMATVFTSNRFALCVNHKIESVTLSCVVSVRKISRVLCRKAVAEFLIFALSVVLTLANQRKIPHKGFQRHIRLV
jgi:hypothetical protein